MNQFDSLKELAQDSSRLTSGQTETRSTESLDLRSTSVDIALHSQRDRYRGH